MTVSAAACTRPGCAGTIDGGYCTVCGLAPPCGRAGAAVPAQAARLGRRSAGPGSGACWVRAGTGWLAGFGPERRGVAGFGRHWRLVRVGAVRQPAVPARQQPVLPRAAGRRPGGHPAGPGP